MVIKIDVGGRMPQKFEIKVSDGKKEEIIEVMDHSGKMTLASVIETIYHVFVVDKPCVPVNKSIKRKYTKRVNHKRFTSEQLDILKSGLCKYNCPSCYAKYLQLRMPYVMDKPVQNRKMLSKTHKF